MSAPSIFTETSEVSQEVMDALETNSKMINGNKWYFIGGPVCSNQATWGTAFVGGR